MLDPSLLRNNYPLVQQKLESRGFDLDQTNFNQLEQQRKQTTTELHQYQQQLNQNAKQIGIAKKQGDDATALLEEAAQLKQQLSRAKEDEQKIQHDYQALMLTLPNLPADDTPLGSSEADNITLRSWGTPRPDTTPPHFELFPQSMDFANAAKIASARFVVLQGALAKLHRSLAQFMLETHIADGYQEHYVPLLVSQESMQGTGQLPKFKQDLFYTNETPPRYLIPTAEVPLTNLASNSILPSKTLPLKMVSHTPCFRSEAGSYGKDMQGLIRQHQFDKVELVIITTAESSEQHHQEMTRQAEKILSLLELPYQVIHLCTGDTGFSAASTYDLEVWLPSAQKYREVSSCSNCKDFQARRMLARYRATQTDKPSYCHTLNGSGVAIGRAMIALIENHYDQNTNSIHIPKALQPFYGEERLMVETN